jgi:hypothetical protein
LLPEGYSIVWAPEFFEFPAWAEGAQSSWRRLTFTLKILHFTFMLFGFLPRVERAEISSLAGLRIFLA